MRVQRLGLRRVLLIPSIVALVLTVPVGEAHAWSNGASGPNGFGTHDWILAAAIDALPATATGWICRERALRATDDPDTIDGLDHASGTWWHVWDEWGSTYGGAPEATEVWYGRALGRLRSGDRCGASRALGIASHFLGDVAQPMHTDGSLAAEDRVHGAYEQAVDSRCNRSGCLALLHFNGTDRVSPFALTLAVARTAHPSYRGLVRAYDRSGFTAYVNRITRWQLSRAANAVADLIYTLYVSSRYREG